MFATGDVFKMLVLYSVLVRQYDNIQVFCSVLVRQYAQYGHVLVYTGILFGLSTLVRLVRPCFHVCWYFFGLSTLVRLVRPCSIHVCIYSVLVRQYAQYGHVLCMLVFYSVLISTLVRLVPMFYTCLYFIRCQQVSTLSMAVFYASWYFFRCQYAQYGHVLCMLKFYSV